ncbi:MAG: peptide deformylase [Myxococcota bacterium]
MAKIPLVYYPDSILTTRSADVTEIDQDVVDFVEAMRETMYTSNGIGLAAPQVGRNVRVMTIDVEPDKGGKAFMHLINPVIKDGYGKTSYEEGCLSFPGLLIEVKRKKQIHLQAYDIDGRLIDLEADGLMAICLQHELDHLNGVVFVDRLNPVQKTIVVRDYLRRREEDQHDDDIDRILALHQTSGGTGAGPRPAGSAPTGAAGAPGLVDAAGRPIASGDSVAARLAREQALDEAEAVVVAVNGRPSP